MTSTQPPELPWRFHSWFNHSGKRRGEKMAYTLQVRRFRSNRKRLSRIQWTKTDKWLVTLLALLVLLAVAFGGWLGMIM
jgi:energy-coupling factor transporter transmembrane protein EcfT